jgi:hypothetical protein
MDSKVINGVKVQKNKKEPKGYVLHIPQNMNGKKLQQWKQDNAEKIQSFLKEEEENNEKDEPG